MWRDALNTFAGPVKYFTFVSENRTLWPYTRQDDKHFILFNEGSGITEIIPNIFTPNGDDLNDRFHIENANVKEFHFLVFNRWGILLFETIAPEIDWDGKTLAGVEVPEGNY